VDEKRFLVAFQIAQSKEVRGHHRTYRSGNKIVGSCCEVSSLSFLLLFSKSARLLLVLLTDVVELLHVLEEVWASLQSDE